MFCYLSLISLSNWKLSFQVGLCLAKSMPQQSRCHPFGRPGGSHSGSSPCRPRQFHQFHQFLHPRHLARQPEPSRELQESAEASWLALLGTDILPVFRLFKRLSPGNTLWRPCEHVQIECWKLEKPSIFSWIWLFTEQFGRAWKVLTGSTWSVLSSALASINLCNIPGAFSSGPCFVFQPIFKIQSIFSCRFSKANL